MGARGKKKVPEFRGFQFAKSQKKIVTNSQIFIFGFQSITKKI
jgi:hypothetical protein